MYPVHTYIHELISSYNNDGMGLARENVTGYLVDMRCEIEIGWELSSIVCVFFATVQSTVLFKPSSEVVPIVLICMCLCVCLCFRLSEHRRPGGEG